MRDQELTSAIIEAAIEVHRVLGPGFLESFYQEALEFELAERRIPFEKQKAVTVLYKGHKIGEHRLDLLVFSKIVVELKVVKQIEPIHYVVVRSYLNAVDCDDGLILSFAKAQLEPKRVLRKRGN